MSKEDMQRLGRNLWGFFAVAVWLVGVPTVCKLAYKGACGAVSEAKAVVYGAEGAHTENKPDVTPETQKDVIEAMNKEDFDEMVSMYYEHKAMQPKKKKP